MAEGINFYIVILANEHVQERYRANDVGALKTLIREHLDLGLMSPFEVADAQPLPSNRVHPAVSPAPEPSAIEPLVVPLTVGPQIFEKLGGRASDSFFV